MRKINFTKMVASGNDFVIAELKNSKQLKELKNLAKNICDRRFGVGADGLLVLEKSKIADIKMRIFNPDGSEPSMCGNGARCVALYKSQSHKVTKSQVKIETKAGIIESRVNADEVKIKLTDPKDIKLNIPIKINKRTLRINFINTGVAHTVVFVEGLDKIDVFNLGRQIRYHRKFKPAGTNVDFVEVLNSHTIKLRTYERGVEDETLACGTGSVASALIFSLKNSAADKVFVYTKGGEILKIYFERKNKDFRNVWLEGKARIVCKGEFYV